MKVSLNIVKQYTDVELSVDELVAKINSQLGGTEEVIDLGAKYKDAKIVKVVECEKHENADKLSVCKIDAGTGELVQVVCGAPNVHADMWAVWLPPESIVPSTYDDAEPFKLGARELRGVMSHGMLAAGDELAINSDHDGIVEITESDLLPQITKNNPSQGETLRTGLRCGASFAETFGLNDTIIDIENKMFTHRPDLFGQLGVAREIAGIQQQQFTSPEWYTKSPEFADATGLSLEVFNDAKEQTPRFMAVAIKGVEVKPSPLWLQCALVAMGGKPINNIVDATNYMMLLTAQPTHAYDYDKLRGNKLGVRMSNEGEKIKLLNNKSYELTPEDIVIVDGEGPVGLAGIMGGGESEVSADTKNIVLEVANFDMYTLRRSSMRHGLFTDALTRFNKGQSPLQNTAVMVQLISMISGTQASDVFDLKDEKLGTSKEVTTTAEFINQRLGTQLSEDDISTLLENVEFTIHHSPFIIHPPFWRTDLELPEDIVEEVGRLYGYDKLPRELPQRTASPVPRNKKRQLEQTIRATLAGAGANELLTYSFVHERVLAAAGQDIAQAYQLTNALSPDLQYYRLSITPSLLEKAHGNIKAGYSEIALFEVGKAHTKTAELVDGVPPEQLRVGFTYAAKHAGEGAPYYYAKRYLDQLVKKLGLAVAYKPLPASNLAVAQPFDAVRRARVVDTATGYPIAIIGEYTAKATKGFKLPAYAAGFELLTEGVQRSVEAASASSYKPLSKYPSTSRDLTLRVGSEVEYAQLLDALHAAKTDDVMAEISPTGVYQAEGENTKNITVHITLSDHSKTLTSEEAANCIDALTASAHDVVQAEVQ